MVILFKILEITGPFSAPAESKEVKKEIYISLLPEEVKPGDWVLIHVGFAIAKVDEEQALQTINFWDEERKKQKSYHLSRSPGKKYLRIMSQRTGENLVISK
ncbi:MAG: HypC/HybG/HupF family hydrogenase formation chaperone [Thermodesulfobacteriaceae bacterium]